MPNPGSTGPKPDLSYSQKVLRARLRYGSLLKPIVVRRPVQLLLDGLCGSAAVGLAYILRFDLNVPPQYRPHIWLWCFAMLFLQPLVLSFSGGYRSTWQHFGSNDFGRIALRDLWLCIFLLLIGAFTINPRWIPFGVALITALLSLCLSSGIRMLRRLDHEALLRLAVTDRVLVVGTVKTIASALAQLQPLFGAGLVGIVLDEEHFHNRRISGVPVLGNINQLHRLIYSRKISMLFLSSAELQKMSEIMQLASSMDVGVKLLPSIHDLVNNRVRVSKKLTVDALRKPEDEAEQLHPEVMACLDGRTVLVTGAAGSIGSELVRQVSTANVRRLLALDQDENGVFELMQELGKVVETRPVEIVPIIADIRDTDAVRSVFQKERPEVVLHAAAYKHVPLMEANPCEAVLNNVVGTRTLAEASIEFSAQRMVMISSDKAVHPSSIMGASKRLAEVVIQDIAHRVAKEADATQFACVRFGNVLGSRGSVLPIFLEQIERGGPITVTHEQMTRYFMTIPQAVSLVLRAATLASHGHIYMLDMGDPVRIVNFARQVIELSGLQPGKDIEIQITGSRPGEKLHEQLWREDAEVTPTIFDQVFEVRAEEPGEGFAEQLTHLEGAARDHDSALLRSLLKQLPIDYLSENSAALEPQAIG